MRLICIALSIVAPLLLGGCFTTDPSESAAALRKAIQEQCGLLVPIAKIAVILQLPGAPAASEIIAVFCQNAEKGRAQFERQQKSFLIAGAAPARARITFEAFGETIQGELLPE